MGASQLVSGDIFDGTYEVEMTIPQYAPGGTWEVQAFVANEEGVERNYGGASEPFPILSDANFTVVNSGLVDSTGPAVVSVSVSPGPIDTGIIAQTVEITLNITDAPSGLRSASLSFINPESNTVNSISGFVFFTQATSGDRPRKF